MKRLLILCLFLIGGLFQASASAMSFHERECKEAFDGKTGSAGQWDSGCLDYVTKDEKRWIGSSGEDSQAGNNPAKPSSIKPLDSAVEVRLRDCEDLICGQWTMSHGFQSQTIAIVPALESGWEFEAVLIDRGTYIIGTKGEVVARYSGTGGGRYFGERVWGNLFGMRFFAPSTLGLVGEGNFISSSDKPNGYGSHREAGLRIGPAPATAGKNPVGGSGTGFFVSSDGIIVTNNHVIDGAEEISVTVPSGETYKAKILTKSGSTDLAVLKIDYQSKDYLTFANPGVTDIGDKVFTLGFPISDLLGKEVKYSEGVINSLSGIKGDATFFQISVPIQPGNSGGPLVNKAGKVVGIVTATAAVEAFYKATGSMPQNVNWAVKGAYAALIVPSSGKTSPAPVENAVKHTKRSVVFIQAE